MRNLLVGIVGLVLGAAVPPASAGAEVSCAEHSIVASAVRTPSDLQAFVQCAYEFVQEVGFAEAKRAFHEDERWKSGPMYVFVTGLEYEVLVSPIFPDREGGFFDADSVDLFGSNSTAEGHRVARNFGRGWFYYTFQHPLTGADAPKSSYVIEIDWDGTPARMGAGIYRRDIPGACLSEEVNAAALAAEPSIARLEEFVRCAAYRVEALGYFATPELTRDPRWRSDAIYVFGLDLWGSQLFSGSPLQRRRTALHEWGGADSPLEQFGGRDMAGVGDAFGETYLYYDAVHPLTGQTHRKVAFVKRVSALGVPVLVGSGYYLDDESQP